jgi:hypothetical protein
MGAWANQTIDQNTFLGWMSSADGFNYFVNSVLPDIVNNGAKVSNPAGSNLGPTADLNTVIVATQAAGANMGLSIPSASLQAAKAPPLAAPVTPVQQPTPAISDGVQAVEDMLNQAGLGALAQQVIQWNNQGMDAATIAAQVRGTDTWKNRFSGIVALQQAAAAGQNVGGIPSEAQALAYEKSMSDMLGQYGITGYGQQDFQRWMGQQKSVAEMSGRANIASQWAYQEPQEARDAVQRLYGINAGDVTHYAFDSANALPEIQKRLDAAQIAGSAQMAGLGGLSAAQAEAIGNYANPAQAAGTLGKIGAQSSLYQGLPGENGNISIDDLIKGYFGGDQAILTQLRMRNQQRDFGQSGGQVAATAKGAIGAGAAAP